MAFEYPTNFSNGTTIDGVGNLMKYANYVTDCWLSYGFLTIIFLISFVVSLSVGSRKAFAPAGFITFIFSIYFARLELVSPIVPFALIVIAILGAIGSKGGSSI